MHPQVGHLTNYISQVSSLHAPCKVEKKTDGTELKCEQVFDIFLLR